MRLAIVGTRTFNDYNLLVNVIHNYISDNSNIDILKLIIVSGGSRQDRQGADTLAENWANDMQIAKLIYPPQLNAYGSPKAYHMRNEQIAVAAEKGICFWDGVSRGSTDVISRFNRHGKDMKIIKYNEYEYRHYKKYGYSI